MTRTFVQLSRLEIAALLAHACKDETRAGIFALHFEIGLAPVRLATVEATDGHRFARFRTSLFEGEPARWVVPVDVAEEAAGIARRVGAQFVRFTPTGYVITDVESIIPGMPTPVEFPRYPMPTPDNEGLGLPSDVNPAYLADLVLVSKAVRAALLEIDLETCRTAKDRKQARSLGPPPVSMYPARGELDPVLFTCATWTVLIMPCRRAVTRARTFVKIVKDAARALEGERAAKVKASA